MDEEKKTNNTKISNQSQTFDLKIKNFMKVQNTQRKGEKPVSRHKQHDNELIYGFTVFINKPHALYGYIYI